MNIKLAWVVDPVKKHPSVSLTNLVISIVCVVVTGFLKVFNKIEDTSFFMEYFSVSSLLYFGRNLNIGGKSYTMENINNGENNEKP